MKLKRYQPKDLPEIAMLFYETINAINIRDYSEAQVRAWSAGREHLLKKNDFFMTLYTILAVQDEIIIGYGNIDSSGYLDHLFVHKDHQSSKAGTAICEELERYIFEQGIHTITVHASITAQSFFIKRGYVTLKEQNVEVRGIKMTNYCMEKKSEAGNPPKRDFRNSDVFIYCESASV